MTAYVVAHVRVTDPAAFQEYAKAAAPALEEYGGKFLALGQNGQTVFEGEQFKEGAVVVLEFDSVERYSEFYNSPGYQAAIKLREGAGSIDFVAIPAAE